MKLFSFAIAIGLACQVYGTTLSDLHPLQIRAFVAQQNYPAALRVCDEMIKFYRDVATIKSGPSFDANADCFFSYYLAVRAQILALSGDMTGTTDVSQPRTHSPHAATRTRNIDAPEK
jgi:hypothetical protein